MTQIAFYKGTRPGVQGIYSRGVRAWTRSKYSHCEFVFDDGMSASASFMDKGVRFKQIDYDPEHWDFIEIPSHYEEAARKWFEDHDKDKYDLMGNFHFVFMAVADDKDKWFCSEAIAAAMGIENPERFNPGDLYSLIKAISDSWKAANDAQFKQEQSA